MTTTKLAIPVILIIAVMFAISITANHFPLFRVDAQAALLMDVDSGKIYYGHNASESLPPASMSKMMTELLVLESIHTNKHTWNEPVTTSHYAAHVTGAQMGLQEGEKQSIRTLFQAMVVHSANDAAIALAEHLGGSETEFVKNMNLKAQEIGLTSRSVFANATGLSSADLLSFPEAATNGDTRMSAQDLAIIARYLIRSYPEILSVTKMTDIQVNGKQASLHTTNSMLPGEAYAYTGNDGFKTGYTQKAGYCFTGTSIRNGKRLIAVVMGSSDNKTRFTDAARLFNYGFKN